VIIAILHVLCVNAVERETEQRRMVCGARNQSCNCHVEIRGVPLEKRQRHHMRRESQRAPDVA
jgi:hypothetical protein